MKKKFNVGKMTCSACVSHVNKAVLNVKGVSNVDVNLLGSSMVVIYDEEITNDNEIIKAVIKAGYEATLYQKVNKDYKKENRVMKYRLTVSIFAIIPLMYFSMYIMQIMKYKTFTSNDLFMFSILQIIFLIPIFIANYGYFYYGFKRLFLLKPNMDSLIAISSSASFVYGIVNTILIGASLEDYMAVQRYFMQLYLDSSGMILTLVTFGKFLESKSKKKTSEAINKLIDLTPKTAIILKNDIEELVNVEDIKIDDLIVIKPGMVIPVDGIIIKGASNIDSQVITGESIPVYKKEGDEVISATMNINGSFIFKATSVSTNSTIAKIIELVEEASNSKASIAALADKISLIFVPVVITISLLTFIIWYFTNHSFEFSFSMAISVLVISCPCALGLATPVAIMVGTGVAAKSGILVKSAQSLQNAHNIKTIVLDKTGTITYGKPIVTKIVTYNITEEELLKIAYSLERHSEHPLANSIINYVNELNINYYEISDFKSIGGKGIVAYIDNKKYIGGNEKLLTDENILIDKYKEDINRETKKGQTALMFARSDSLLGIIYVSDTIKENSLLAIKKFKQLGLEVIALTGDNKKTSEAILKDTLVDEIIADVLPSQKQQVIKDIQNNNKVVAMVGDGINDSIALMTSDVGIAIGAGSDIALESADIILIKNDLLDAYNAIKLSKTVFKTVKMNLFWAFIYNIFGIPLAAGVLYPLFGLKLVPMFGALAMSLSSLCVVLNASRIKKFKTVGGLKQMNKIIKVEGMMCNHCVKAVKDALLTLEDIKNIDIDLKKKKVSIEFLKHVDDKVVYDVIKNAGYNPSEYVEKKGFLFKR